MLENFMKWELTYINTSHPDFVGIAGGPDVQVKGIRVTELS